MRSREIKFSENDKKIGVKIPNLNDPLLAYLVGVHLGDGSMQMVTNGTNSIRFFGHKEDDWNFFSEKLPMIIKKLFNKDVRPTMREDQNTCVLSICSKAVVTFLHNVLNIPAGNKKKIQGLPNFIKNDKNLLINCIRGIADTDFSITFQKDNRGKPKYPLISCTMANQNIIKDLSDCLNGFGFKVISQFNMKRFRNGKINIEHRIQIYGKEQLEKWMELIGFWNSCRINKLNNYGFCF